MPLKSILTILATSLIVTGLYLQVAVAHPDAPAGSETKAACCTDAAKHTDDAVVTTAVAADPTKTPRIGFFDTDGSYYPISTCPISGEVVNHDPAKLAKFDLDGRTVYTCCSHCKETIIADPAKYNQVLDELVIAQQSADYPIKTCPISGEELGGMGEPVKFVVNNYLVEVCCGGCEAAVKANPDKVLAELQAFWSAPKPE
ncbi:MAG: hypothetical protein ABI743_04680 [bacterium]